MNENQRFNRFTNAKAKVISKQVQAAFRPVVKPLPKQIEQLLDEITDDNEKQEMREYFQVRVAEIKQMMFHRRLSGEPWETILKSMRDADASWLKDDKENSDDE